MVLQIQMKYVCVSHSPAILICAMYILEGEILLIIQSSSDVHKYEQLLYIIILFAYARYDTAQLRLDPCAGDGYRHSTQDNLQAALVWLNQ